MEAISMEDPPGAQETQSLLQRWLCPCQFVVRGAVNGTRPILHCNKYRHVCVTESCMPWLTAISAGDMEAISMEDPPGTQETQSLLQLWLCPCLFVL